MLWCQTARMTTAIRMTLHANGELIEGEGHADGDSGFIECLAYTDGVTTDQAPTGRSLGRRHYEPVVIRKYIDRTTPQLLQALTDNAPIDAVFRFYRPSAQGYVEHYFTVEVTGGRIVSIERSWSQDSPAEAEDVGIAPATIRWTHEHTGSTVQSRPRTLG